MYQFAGSCACIAASRGRSGTRALILVSCVLCDRYCVAQAWFLCAVVHSLDHYLPGKLTHGRYLHHKVLPNKRCVSVCVSMRTGPSFLLLPIRFIFSFVSSAAVRLGSQPWSGLACRCPMLVLRSILDTFSGCSHAAI